MHFFTLHFLTHFASFAFRQANFAKLAGERGKEPILIIVFFSREMGPEKGGELVFATTFN
jgi:hypothetical protein